MGWFKGKKDKGGADSSVSESQEKSPNPPQRDQSPPLPEPSANNQGKLTYATSMNGFSAFGAPQATVNRIAEGPGDAPKAPVTSALTSNAGSPSPTPPGTAPSASPGLAPSPAPSSAPSPPEPTRAQSFAAAVAAAVPAVGGLPNLRPISTAPTTSSGPATSSAMSSEISVATPVQGTVANTAGNKSAVFSGTANGTFKPKTAPPAKAGTRVEMQQERIVELEDQVSRLQRELDMALSAKDKVEDELKGKSQQVQNLMKQLTAADSSSSPNSKRSDGVEREGSGSGEEVRTADDLHAALRAFREQSQSKLADTLRQNQELRTQVENYEAMCRSIGEVLRDYEWLQQCRIVTGDLDLGRLRKSMMKLWHTGKTRAVLPVLAMVLAFGPDDVQRCRTVISTAKQEADMVDYIPEIIQHNMDENMKRDAITIYIEAHKEFTEDTNIAMYLTDKFAEKYKGEWHCVVGEQYALSSCYESKVIKFKSGHRSVILWSN